MDDRSFDEITRRLAVGQVDAPTWSGGTRRAVLGRLAGGALTGLLSVLGQDEANAKRAKKKSALTTEARKGNGGNGNKDKKGNGDKGKKGDGDKGKKGDGNGDQLVAPSPPPPPSDGAGPLPPPGDRAPAPRTGDRAPAPGTDAFICPPGAGTSTCGQTPIFCTGPAPTQSCAAYPTTAGECACASGGPGSGRQRCVDNTACMGQATCLPGDPVTGAPTGGHCGGAGSYACNPANNDPNTGVNPDCAFLTTCTGGFCGGQECLTDADCQTEGLGDVCISAAAYCPGGVLHTTGNFCKRFCSV
jgi:hypothetical protein